MEESKELAKQEVVIVKQKKQKRSNRRKRFKAGKGCDDSDDNYLNGVLAET